MKNSLMLWTLSVLLLSVIIECRKKNAEEKPQQKFLEEVDNTSNNQNVNQTEIKGETQPKGSLAEAKDIQRNRLNGNRNKQKSNNSHRKTNPAARTELNPAARIELNPAARKNENKRPRRRLSEAKKRNN